ncbi:HupE/UreJ family protein [Chitinophaga oryziterrae]|uniref:HupE/UreJ family protein n=1 Tax=Chitinophaga oryziterrae TaxID=1031224 RepID=A0A6N8J6Q2_9BACT|nr:HupE/UreJ family protein [Chitinophaga oryziterrae]MVT40917.1 HupE/UreJ family protein [Chitinophaga oryziterrae]
MAEFVMYFEMGWQHIVAWDGYDHILFIIALCAIYVMEDWKKVLVLVTAFTIGHSVTLALSVTNILHIPTKTIEFLIPVTIFITAFSNVVRKQAIPEKIQLNYFFALFFGLIHGLGFSSYLKSLLGTQTNIVAPLLAFNLGLEFGQMLVVMGILLFTGIIVNITGVKRREWNIFLSAAIFGIAVMLSIERLKDLISK